jgi:hypothetical protein
MRSSYDLRWYIRVWCVAFVGGLLGFVLALLAGDDINGLLGTTGAVIALTSVTVGFLAFTTFVIVAVFGASRRRRHADDDPNAQP